MAKVTRIFNGTTASFGGTAVGKLIGISYKEGGNWIEITEPADLNKLYEIGQADLQVQLKFKGGDAGNMTYGDKDTLSITWSDGSTTACPGTWMVGPKDVEGSWDNPISSTRELRPTVPDSA